MDGCTSIYGYFLLCVFSVLVRVGDSTTVVTTNVTYAVNTSVFIKCVVSNVSLSLWSFRYANATSSITVGVAVTKNETYLNITSIPYTELSTYDLIIPHVSLELEGQYDCWEKGERITSAYIMVEVPPVVLLKIDDNIVNGTIHTEADKELSIQCVAVGGHPSVSLSWQVDDQMLITDVTTRTLEDGTVLSDLRYRPRREDKVIRCSTNGQIATPNVTEEANFNILYKPACYSQLINTTDDGLFICHCSANPTPNVSILANGTFLSDQRTTILTFRHPVNLSCLSSNYLGTVQSDNRLFLPKVEDDSHADDETSTPTGILPDGEIYILPAVGGLFVLGLSLLLVYQCCIKRWTQARSFNLRARQRETNLQPQTWATMSDRPPRPTPQKQSRINAYSYAKEPLFNAETTLMCDSKDTFLSKSQSANGSSYNICYETNKRNGIGYNARESNGSHKYERMPSLEVEHNSPETSQVRPTAHAYHVLEKETVDTSSNDQQKGAAFIATQSEGICETDIKADDLTRSQDDKSCVSTGFDNFETSSSQDTTQPQSPSNEPSYCQDTEIPLYDDPPLD